MKEQQSHSEISISSDLALYQAPMPAGHGQSGSSTDKADKDKKRPEAPVNTKGQQNQNKHQKGAAKGAGKGPKGKKRDPVPQSLKGMHSRTPQGDPICFAFNLGSCKQGATCPRKHVCAVPGCYKAHPQTEHQ